MELTDGTVSFSGNDYRLQNIVDIQKQLEFERTKRGRLSTNYNKSLKVVNAADGDLAVSFMGLNTVSVVFLSTVVAAPAATAIEAVSLGAGLLFITGGFVSRSLKPRAEKHERIKLLADKKLNLISDLVSKDLNDEMISDEEHSLILSEFNKFVQKKQQIRKKAKVQIDKESKRSLINKFKANATEMIRKH